VTRLRPFLVFGAVLLGLAGLIFFQARSTSSPAVLLSTASPEPTPGPTATPRPLRVYVSGAVRRPDVYSLPPDAIVKDALLAAGGPAAGADLDRLNLAQPLADGQQVHVPRQGEAGLPSPAGPATRAGTGGLIDVNHAGAAALESLPGIGPSLAAAIVAYREAHGPFLSVDALLDVPGIGPATLDKIRALITTN